MSKKHPITLDDLQAWLEHLKMIEVPGDAVLIQPRGQGFNPNRLVEISTQHRGSTFVLNHEIFGSPADTSIDYMSDEPISDKANKMKKLTAAEEERQRIQDKYDINKARLEPVEGYAAGVPQKFEEKTIQGQPTELLPVGYRFKTDKGMVLEVQSYEDFDTYLCLNVNTGHSHVLQGAWIKQRERVAWLVPKPEPKHYTTHGHEAKHGPLAERPQLVARCGGPGMCSQCSQEASAPF